MDRIVKKREAHLKRKRSIRKKITGTAQRPRLCVSRSLSHIYLQVIDDTCGKTLVSASCHEKKVKENAEIKNKVSKANFVGKLVADRAIEKGIKKVVFDRNGFLYHGRVKAASDGAREAGLDF
jgi:large subunit ribosomal protein L18